MSKELWVIRHSYKLSYEPEKWKKHPRYKENPFDEPLTDFGMALATEAGANLIKKSKDLKAGKITYIYCSPFTRCIQTAIQIIKEVKKVLKLDLKIIVVYGLGESIIKRPTISFQGSKIKPINPVSVSHRGSKKKWKSILDKKMSPANLKKRFKGYVTGVIAKPYGIETWREESERMFKAIKAVGDQKSSGIILGHTHTIDLAYNYYSGKTPVPSYTFGGSKDVCVTVGFEKKSKKWKMSHKPKIPSLKKKTTGRS